MLKKVLWCVLCVHISIVANSQEVDTLRTIEVEEISVVCDFQTTQKRLSPLPITIVNKEKLAVHFSGDLMKTLDYIPGVQSMSVGSGFSKPMIRGMGFNRVIVTENGIKQEGQQWGSDHGLEIDAFNIDEVNIRKGSSSLLYGSDAMGGVIEILPPTVPSQNCYFGSVDLLGRSVNGLLGGSAMLGLKQGNWYARIRHSEQHFGDFAVPTDSVVYLTQNMPITNNRVNNTAGFERSSNVYLRYGSGRFSSALALSNTYQKSGFYPGAHGIPDPSSVVDDGDYWDIDLPYSFVNHFKASLQLKYSWTNTVLSWDLAYQNNHREEWSEFHTHYGTQNPPEVDPDKEIALYLDTYSSGVKVDMKHSYGLHSTASWDASYQNNTIGGYSFLLPNYTRLTSGLAWVTTYHASSDVTISGGLRYDFGHINAEEYSDPYLADYLVIQGYDDATVAANEIRSYALDRYFGDYSLSLGAVWDVDFYNTLRFNIGRSYRLPGANELVSNGVHHSSFRHEQGDPTLDSERGWQLDMEYIFSNEFLVASVSPFFSWYSSCIYLQPTGEWSILPHAGQIYRYTQSEAILAGGEVSVHAMLPLGFGYDFALEYTYTYNVDESLPLSFSPPLTMLNTVSWEYKWMKFAAEWEFIADQNRVARNEDATPGAHLFNASVIFDASYILEGATVVLSVDNIFNTEYLNHLSYYRQVEIPEPGRNFQISLKLPFTL